MEGLSNKMVQRKKYTSEFKAQVVLEILKEEKSLSQLSSEHGIHTTQLNRWKTKALEELPQLFSDEAKASQKVKAEYEKQVSELYSEIGRLTTQLSWLKKKSGIKSE